MNRAQRLKAKLFEMDDRALFLERIEIIKACAERYAAETAGVRFGHTLQALLSGISIVIDEDDLIVGRVAEVLPSDEQERWFEANRAEFDRPPWFYTDGHLTLSWERLMNEGLDGIRRRARAHLDRLRPEDGTAPSKADFLQGALLCCDAIEGYAQRYADRAEEMARSAPAPARAQEWLHIAEVCRRVPARPAHTLHEAVQGIWFVDLVLHAVVGARDFALGRIDQYLYPFYQRDLAAGRITPQQAQELIECLYIKCSEIIGQADQVNARKRSPCQDSVQYVVLGGQTVDGRDATNPLSTICLQAGYLKLKQPTIKVRYVAEMDPAFWHETCALVRDGGSIGIYNDAVVIPAFESVGVDPGDARDYVYYGCCNPNVPGKEGSLMHTWHGLPKFLALALNDGIDPLTGERAGPRTGDPDLFSSVDDLLGAIQLQVRHAMEVERARHAPLPPEAYQRCSFTLESIFLEDCIENGREWRLAGAKYWHTVQYGVGIATMADSLAAIQQVVFERGELSLAELRDVLDADFAGHEALRQKLRNRCLKYGNGDPAVDALARRVADMWCDEVLRGNETAHNIRFWPGIYSYHQHRRLGTRLGATADGRRSGQPLSENQSPNYGMDRQGITACLDSIAQLPLHRSPGGGTNLKVHPSAVRGEDGLRALGSLIETFFARGGQHLQLNVVDGALLREAQRQPEQYRTLSVRVVGYSAYFGTLSRAVQDDIIQRTEYQL